MSDALFTWQSPATQLPEHAICADCQAGLCVRLVTGGLLSETWGLPHEG